MEAVVPSSEVDAFIRQHIFFVFGVLSFIQYFAHKLLKYGFRLYALNVLKLKEKDLTKFSEHALSFIYYTTTFTVSCFVCYQKIWFWNISKCWTEYPYRTDGDVLWYFLFQETFYFASLIHLLTSGSASKNKVMITHHIVTLFLVGLSYLSGHTRVGMLVFMVHDCSDIFMEMARLANYAKANRIKNISFVVFGIVFFITRLIIYPFHIIKSVLFESSPTAPLTPYGGMKLYYIFLGLLLSLQVMHLYWMFLICRMIIKFFSDNMDVKKDIRSDEDEDLKEE
eukprot:TRINITY_DN6166_c0_g1_i1.p1 TRINITY_DN6166_c0_g1~~TRINITY_DN6166_c0_g1_i1.p1  ORF type:complete len:282 (+),score=23.58 TRINITY_DN6166_c0_g1_i1:50-895(+)